MDRQKTIKNTTLILIIASILALTFIFLLLFQFFLSKRQGGEQKLPPPGLPEKTQPLLPKEISKTELSQIEKPTRPPELPLPQVVFNTQGKITQIGADFILVDGNGSNFEDQKPRILKVKFTPETKVNEKGYTKSYQGFEGLKYLKTGDEILIESQENIREKTEFQASYITKL
jgi:hypothetical protein